MIMTDRNLLPAYAIDMGTPCDSKGHNNFGWACISQGRKQSGDDIDQLAIALDRDLGSGSVALGIEAPIVLPLRSEPKTLTKARPGESNRPWSAGAGASVAVITMPITHYLLSKRGNCRRVVFSRKEATCPGDLFVWEAFVTGPAKGDSDIVDANKALSGYLDHTATLLPDQGSIINTIAAVALRLNLESDLAAPVEIWKV